MELRLAIGLALALFLGIDPAAASSNCGRREDSERTSYRALTWEDFQGPPPTSPKRGRIQEPTEVEIRLAIRVDALPVSAERRRGAWVARATSPCVRAYVLKRHSGRLASAFHQPHARDVALVHEQGHFDLTQLAAQRLQALLARLEAEAGSRAGAERALRAAAERAYRDAVLDLEQEQARYDRSTTHGNHRARQARWMREVAAQLATEGGTALARRR